MQLETVVAIDVTGTEGLELRDHTWFMARWTC